MKVTRRYPAQVYWSDEDGGFIAIAPDLPGCSAFGKTQERALVELQDAVAGWIEAAKAVGNPIPDPSRLPAPTAYSGKILVRMARELHGQLAQAAKGEGVSLNQYINQVLSMAMGRRAAQEHRSKPRSVASTPAK